MWVMIVVVIVSALVSYATRPHPQDPQPSTLNDVSIPTIQQGTAVAVVFGTVWIDQWFVLYYGDLANQPIKSGGKK